MTTLLAPLPALQPLPDTAPDEHWEGKLTGAYGAAVGGHVDVKARLALTGAIIEGRGFAPGFPARRNATGVDFAVTGVRRDSCVDFELWFDDAEVGRTAFSCTGALSDGEDVMTGDWSCGCFYPDTCNCAGTGGHFRLERVR